MRFGSQLVFKNAGLTKLSTREAKSVGFPPSLDSRTQLEYLNSRVLTYTPLDPRPREILPSGEVHSTRYGSHYVMRKTYPDGYEHGKIRLGRFSTPDLQQLMQLVKHRATAGDRDRIVFLDTET